VKAAFCEALPEVTKGGDNDLSFGFSSDIKLLSTVYFEGLLPPELMGCSPITILLSDSRSPLPAPIAYSIFS
jgi:hypothetical protein